jgi:hypothetical protein
VARGCQCEDVEAVTGKCPQKPVAPDAHSAYREGVRAFCYEGYVHCVARRSLRRQGHRHLMLRTSRMVRLTKQFFILRQRPSRLAPTWSSGVMGKRGLNQHMALESKVPASAGCRSLAELVSLNADWVLPVNGAFGVLRVTSARTMPCIVQRLAR